MEDLTNESVLLLKVLYLAQGLKLPMRKEPVNSLSLSLFSLDPVVFVMKNTDLMEFYQVKLVTGKHFP